MKVTSAGVGEGRGGKKSVIAVCFAPEAAGAVLSETASAGCSCAVDSVPGSTTICD